MTWTLNGIRLYVQEKDNDIEQILARLNPYNGPTILHRWGRESEKLTLNALVLTSGDIGLLDAMTIDTTSYAFITPEGAGGNWIVKKLSWSRDKSVRHVFFDRPSVPDDAPLYRVSMELYIDES